MAVAGQSNEITVIPELLKILDLEGALVSSDALGCPKELAKQVLAAGGDYLLAFKDNQPTCTRTSPRPSRGLRGAASRGCGTTPSPPRRRGTAARSGACTRCCTTRRD
jgi:hypothetical protein